VARARTLVLKTQVEVTGADKLNNLGKKMQTVGRNLTVGVTLPLVAAGGALVAMAEEAARADAELKRTFDSMGAAAFTTVDALKRTQKELQSTTTFADEEISHLQSVLLTFGNVTGDAFDRATEAALDMSALLGQDLQASAIQLGKALNDPIRGITALRRVGVSFTEQQVEQIRVMTEAGEVAQAQGIILSEVERQFGGAAEALAETAGGQLKQALNELSDAGEEFGAIIAPVLRDIAGAATEFAKALQRLTPEQRQMIVQFGLLAAAAGPVLLVLGSIVRAVGALVPLAARLSKFTAPLLAIGSAAKVASGDLESLADVASGFDPFGALSALESIAEGLENDLEVPVHDAAITWAEEMAAIQDSAYNAMNGAGGVVPTIAGGVDDMATEMGEAPGKMADELLANQFSLTDATSQLVAFMEQALTPAQEMFQLQGFLASRELAQGLASNNPLVRQKAAEMRDAALEQLAGLNRSAFNYGFTFGATYAAGIVNSLGVVRDAGRQLASTLRRTVAIESEPEDPNSPLHGITKWGANLVRTYASSMLGAIPTLTNATAAIGRAAVIGGSAMSPTALAGGSGSSTVINNYYLQWDGEPPKGRSEAEIIANLQRMSPLVSGGLAVS
jgi:hypothetical protein